MEERVDDTLKKYMYYKKEILIELKNVEHNDAYDYINDNILNIVDFYIDIYCRINKGEISSIENVEKSLTEGIEYIKEVLEYTLEKLREE